MKFKLLLVSVFFICNLLSGICLAQNKVVVIPLDSGDCNCDQIPTVTSAGQVWMDRNLGALRVALSVDDYHAYGWLYQWGRLSDIHQDRESGTTATLSLGDNPSHDDFILSADPPLDWRSPQNPNLWQGASGINNPCPTGFRVPTEAEWQTEIDSWNTQDAAGAFASPLKLVVAGNRIWNNGFVSVDGETGVYWSSTVSGNSARYLYLHTSGYAWYSGPRAAGFSVRCIMD